MNNTILKMTNINKQFSGVHALKGVDFNLRKGEVHALMGENGAGKSTLMKILTGIYKADSGEIFVFNDKCDFNSVKDSQEKGIAIIHQELNLISDLTVAQNIFLGREINGLMGFINDRKMNEEAIKILKYVGAEINPYEKVSNLTIGKQQMVEIAKAISFDSKILILDEPTATLTDAEVKELFRIMVELKQKGIAMIYISHRMNEIEVISDRVTVLRDGEYIATDDTNSLTKEKIIKMMVGREIIGEIKENKDRKMFSEVSLEVKNLEGENKFRNISFKLHKGEILGFCGLMGAGRTELARGICGADKLKCGEIFVNGEKVNFKKPYDAVKKGICYLSEDRKRFCLLLEKSVAENTVLSSLENYIKHGFINDKKIISDAKEQNQRLKTKTTNINEKIKNLSGGNQQKVIIARWLLKNSDIFIFDEPTRGIDIGAKSDIYSLIKKLAEQNKSVIVISSEFNEIKNLADRVLVMSEGEITKELNIHEITQENIIKYSMKRA